MNDDFAISVIVLLHNAENTIERCVDSLCLQSQNELELVFVDDLSSDNSLAVLERALLKYPDKATNSQIIKHTTNLGTGTARNTGLKCARGKYIIYCDSDDWVEPNMYHELYKIVQEQDADIVICDFFRELPHIGKTITITQNIPQDDKIQLLKLALSSKLHNAMWNKLVKKELFMKNHVNFPEGINMWEDLGTITRLYYYASNIQYTSKPYYHYVLSPTGITAQRSISKYRDKIKVVELLDSFFAENLTEITNCPEFDRLKFNAKIDLLAFPDQKNIQTWKQIYPEANKLLYRPKQISFNHIVYTLNRHSLFSLSKSLQTTVSLIKSLRRKRYV